MLPDFELLSLQWPLTRIAATVGCAGFQEGLNWYDNNNVMAIGMSWCVEVSPNCFLAVGFQNSSPIIYLPLRPPTNSFWDRFLSWKVPIFWYTPQETVLPTLNVSLAAVDAETSI